MATDADRAGMPVPNVTRGGLVKSRARVWTELNRTMPAAIRARACETLPCQRVYKPKRAPSNEAELQLV